jgi:MFS family permease
MDEGGQLKRQRQAALIAIILFITVLVGYLARVSISVALPFIKIDYGWNNEQLGSLGGLLLGIFLIGYGLSNIFLSPLLDCYGPRKGLLIAVTAWSILTFLTGIVGVYYSVFILLRFLLGIAQGVLFPSASKVTQAWFPPGRRSRMNALYHSSLELSNLLSPLLLIPLIMTINWQFMFVVLAAAGFIILIPIWLYLRDAPEPLPECERKGLVENLRLARDNLGGGSQDKGTVHPNPGSYQHQPGMVGGLPLAPHLPALRPGIHQR